MCSSDKVQFGVCGGGCVDVRVCGGACVCVRDRYSILKPVLQSTNLLHSFHFWLQHLFALGFASAFLPIIH